MIIIAVSGWRHWVDTLCVHTQIELQVARYGADNIFWRVGDCPTGVNRIARSYISMQLPSYAGFTMYTANWSKFRHAAEPIRNEQMLKGRGNDGDPNPGVFAHRLLAFPQPGIDWKLDTSGTVTCILKAVDLGISLEVPGCKVPM